MPCRHRRAGAAVREGRLRPEHHGADADVCGAVAELEHPRRLLRADLARPRAVFRARRLHHRASLHQIRRAAVVRHARRRRDIGADRDGARLSLFPPARALLRHRHHRHCRDRAAAVPELGLGRRRARHRHSRARRQLAQIPVHAQQAAVFLFRAGAGLRRLARDLVAGGFQMGLLVARRKGQSGRRRKPRRGRVQFQDGRRGGLGLPHRGRRQLLRAVRVLHRSRKRHGLPVLAADGAAGGARRHRHAVGTGARRRHPDPAHRTDALLHRRLRPRRRPDRLRHADRADLAGAAAKGWSDCSRAGAREWRDDAAAGNPRRLAALRRPDRQQRYLDFGRARRDRRTDRPQRRRQVDAVQPDRGRAAADARFDLVRRRGRHRAAGGGALPARHRAHLPGREKLRDHDRDRQRHRRRAGPHHRDARGAPQGP